METLRVEDFQPVLDALGRLEAKLEAIEAALEKTKQSAEYLLRLLEGSDVVETAD